MTNHEDAQIARQDAIDKHWENIGFYIADEIMVFIKAEVKAIMRLVHGADLVEENELLRERLKGYEKDRPEQLEDTINNA